MGAPFSMAPPLQLLVHLAARTAGMYSRHIPGNAPYVATAGL